MSLRAVFSPRSVMVIGASHQTGSVGNDVVKNLAHSFPGKIYPVNPKGGELYGLEVYESVKAIPKSVELAVVAVPGPIVPEVLKDAGKKKIKAAIVLSAGFKEVGQTELEEELVNISEKYGFTLIGPNCLGAINPHMQLNASFAPSMPPKGGIAFLSQSGAIGVGLMDYANEQNIGFSKFLSVGNQAAVSEVELLNFLAKDAQTKVILMYVEQFSQLAPILKIAQKMRRERHPKPIVVLKAGKTAEGAAAAQSHTGSLAGSEAHYEALFRQAGILQAQTIEELFLFAECFIYNKLLKKDRVAVITNAGGLGVLTTDALVKQELTLAKLSESTKKSLQKFLPSSASVHNPVDILGDAPAERYQKTLDLVSKDENVDALLVLLTPQSMTEVNDTARAIAALKKSSKKPIVVSFLGGGRVTEGIDILEDNALAVADFPEEAAEGLGALHKFTEWKDRDDKPESFRDFDHKSLHALIKLKKATKKSNGWLDAQSSLAILEACKLPLPAWHIINSEKDVPVAAALCGDKSDKMVLKIIASSVLHKSDVGGVILNVTKETLSDSYHDLVKTFRQNFPGEKLDGILCMEQVTAKGQEIIVGALKDPQLGTLVGCGMGGVYTEIFHDAAFNLTPLTPEDITDILDRLKITEILEGARGGPKLDVKSLKECLARISQLVTQYPLISELDINPLLVMARSKGSVVLDARIKLSEE